MIGLIFIVLGMLPYAYMEQRHRGRRGSLVDLRMVGIVVMITGWVITFFEYSFMEAVGRIVVETLAAGFVWGILIPQNK